MLLTGIIYGVFVLASAAEATYLRMTTAVGSPDAILPVCGNGSTDAAVIESFPNYIESHEGFGSQVYDNNLNCWWDIRAPKDHRIRLTFTTFNLEASSRCAYDNLTINDVVLNNATTICGEKTNYVYQSEFNHVTLNFVTDHSVQKNGFQAKVTFEHYVPLSGCGGSKFLTGAAGSFSSLASSSYCHWVINAPEDKVIQLDFTTFGIVSATPDSCSADSLTIYNGPLLTSKLLGRFCGNLKPQRLYSTGKLLNIVFRTDNPSRPHEYDVEYSMIPKPGLKLIKTVVDAELLSGCGGFKARNASIPGDITSMNFDGVHNYLPNAECTWTIKAPAGMVVRLNFLHFLLEDAVNCQYDSVSFYDGESIYGSPLMAKYCGTKHDHPDMYSTDNVVTVRFITDSSREFTGFRISYDAIDRDDIPTVTTPYPTVTTASNDSANGCGGPSYLEGETGYFNSNGFNVASPSSGQYLPNSNCFWLITADPGQLVHLAFLHFDLEGGSGCRYDYVQVFDGPDSNSMQLGKFCGPLLPASLRSTGRSMFVRFITDHSVQKTGFRAKFTKFDPSNPPGELTTVAPTQPMTTTESPWGESGCGNVKYMNATSGVFTSMNFDGTNKYLPNAHCRWIIDGSEQGDDHVVQLSFDHFDLESSNTCQYDYIEVFDGLSANANKITRVCGNSKPEPISSTGPRMFVQFITDASQEYTGFKATYKVWVPPPTCAPNQFTCKSDGSCIPVSGRCNDIAECPDGSDEEGCLGKDCGVPYFEPWLGNSFNRIVGGRPAKEGSWPWQVQMLLYGRHFCGGSLITDQWVLTAAHCVHGRETASNWQMELGRHNKIGTGETHQSRKVIKVIKHAQYDSGKIDYDVALMKLQTSVRLDNWTKTVCLASRAVVDNEDSYTTGWGSTKGTGHDSVLKQALVPIVSRTRCNSAQMYNGGITVRMICAGHDAGGHDACQGDSGGPLVIKVGEKWHLFGVTSWGYGCAQAMKPGVYADVFHFLDWVTDKIATN